MAPFVSYSIRSSSIQLFLGIIREGFDLGRPTPGN
jgi:hypothetical protein